MNTRAEERNILVRRFFSRTGYTGRILEEETVGRCIGYGTAFMGPEEAMDFARSNQPKGPSPIASRLRELIAEALEAHLHEVAVYSAVGTKLDRSFGIDGWVEFRGVTVTFDVTLNPRKCGAQADFVIPMLHSETDLKPAALVIAGKLSERAEARALRVKDLAPPKHLESKVSTSTPWNTRHLFPKPAPRVSLHWLVPKVALA